MVQSKKVFSLWSRNRAGRDLSVDNIRLPGRRNFGLFDRKLEHHRQMVGTGIVQPLNAAGHNLAAHKHMVDAQTNP